jgi:hypothetical protein
MNVKFGNNQKASMDNVSSLGIEANQSIDIINQKKKIID